MEKLAIAKEFVGLHKDFDVESAGGLERVYENLAAGVYGEVEVVEDRSGMLEAQVEIGELESRTGRPVLFTWEDSGNELRL